MHTQSQLSQKAEEKVVNFNSMNFMKKYILSVAVVGVSALGGVIYLSTQASAAENISPQPTLIERIASRFNLSKDEVQTVFNENREVRQAEHRKQCEERLDKAVADGKITTDQKKKILDKQAELKAKYKNGTNDWRAMTLEERRAQHTKHRTEIETWAKENGIDASYFTQKGMLGKGTSHGRGMMQESN